MGEPTMEEYMMKTREDYESGIARPKIDEKARFELKGQFIKELHDNTFSGSDDEDANEHIEKGLDVPTRQILDSKGAIPSMKAADAKKAIQDMADHSQKWHNRAKFEQQMLLLESRGLNQSFGDSNWENEQGTSREEFFKPNQSIIPFPSRLIDYSYEEKYVLEELMLPQINSNESTTNLKRLLKKKPKMRYQIEASINVHNSAILEDSLPPKEKDPGSFTVPCYINNICFENALAYLGASVSVMPTFTNLGLGELTPTKLIIELADRIIKGPKGIVENVLVGIDKFIFPIDFIVLDMPEDIKVPLILEKPFLSTAHAKRLRERMDLDLEAKLIVEDLIMNRSLDPVYGDYIELNDLNEPLELRRNQVEDLGQAIVEGEVVDEPMVEIIKTRNDEEIEGIDEYLSFCDFDRKIHNYCAYNLQFSCMIVVKNMDTYRDQDMGELIVGKPFCRASCVEARRFDDGNDNVTYHMAHSHPRFKHLTNKQCNKIRPLLKISTRDKLNGISHPYQKLKTFYKGVLDLGPEYIINKKKLSNYNPTSLDIFFANSTRELTSAKTTRSLLQMKLTKEYD
ncbi:retrovirus-related pol polyprotein from transposon TNT 1-94 [Tanacetum coccineum]